MKKLLLVLLSISLFFAFAVSSSASSYKDYNFGLQPYDEWQEEIDDEVEGLDWHLIVYTDDNGMYRAIIFNAKPYLVNTNKFSSNCFNYYEYVYGENDSGETAWLYDFGGSNSISIDFADIIFTSYDLTYNGQTLYAYDTTFWENLTMDQKLNNVVSDSITNQFKPNFISNVSLLVSIGVIILVGFVVVSLLKKKNILHL